MDNYYRRMKPFLGTFVEIGVSISENDYEQFVNIAFNKIAEVNEKLNFHSKNSELSILNNANGAEVKMSKISVVAIKLAKGMTKASNMQFNCTMGEEFSNPNSYSFGGTSDDIIITRNRVKLRANVKLILDGIAKGFAVDLAVTVLKRSGVKSGWVNAGGDLRVFGELEWPIHIKGVDGKTKALLKLKNAAIATSSTVEDKDVSRFTGRILSSINSNSDIGTWSVVAKKAWRADALTKVAANTPKSQRESHVSLLGGHFITLSEDYS